MAMQSASQSLSFPTHDREESFDSTGLEGARHPIDGDSLEPKSRTKTALLEAAKTFGRVVYKVPYCVALLSFEIPSVCTEFLTGCAGAVVGGLAGSTAILARKCMGAKARRFFGLENLKSLRDYATTGFHTGARLGELPGKILGGCGLISLGASFYLSSGIMIPVMLGISGLTAAVCATRTYKCTKSTGAKDISATYGNWINSFRISEQQIHTRLKGIDFVKIHSHAFKVMDDTFQNILYREAGEVSS